MALELSLGDLTSSSVWTGMGHMDTKTGLMVDFTFMFFRRDNRRWSMGGVHRFRKAFTEMLAVLQGVPNVTSDMITYDDTEEDLDRFGYLFEEGVLPSRFERTLDAGRYILARVLENTFGFEWVNRDTSDVMIHPASGISLDLAQVGVGYCSVSAAIDDCYDSIRTTLARRGIFPVGRPPGDGKP